MRKIEDFRWIFTIQFPKIHCDIVKTELGSLRGQRNNISCSTERFSFKSAHLMAAEVLWCIPASIFHHPCISVVKQKTLMVEEKP